MTVIGGPAVNEKLIADKYFQSGDDFLKFLGGEKNNSYPDFSIWDLDEYFTPKSIIPLKLTSTCYYKQCAFCSHFTNIPYSESELENLKKTIISFKQKIFFLIDDMIPKKRLLEFAEMIKPLNCHWICQLRPTKEWDFETLKKLRESGLILIMWGVESGSQRILNLIRKGTRVEDISIVLENSFKSGISNVVYTLVGFPTETKEEFLETLKFLESNKEYIDLVSPTVFGLHRGTYIYNNPEKYGLKIFEEERTVLEPKITYEVTSGLSQKEATRLKDRHKKRFEKINNYATIMNFFREHMICLLDR